MTDVTQEKLERDVIKACLTLRLHMNVSAFVLPPFGNSIACFGTRADILDLLRNDKQWVVYEGAD